MPKNFPSHILSVSIAVADKPGRVGMVLTMYPESQNASIRSFWPSGEERGMVMLTMDQLYDELMKIKGVSGG